MRQKKSGWKRPALLFLILLLLAPHSTQSDAWAESAPYRALAQSARPYRLR